MTTIIAGGFELHADAERAMALLSQAGVPPGQVCTFRVNPPGEHDRLPAGGDRDKSPGATHADGGSVKGAVVGAAVGLAAGVAASPLLGPVALAGGAAVGAYTGSLVGALRSMDEDTADNQIRPAESLVAVNADAAGITPARIIKILRESDALQVERTKGRWEGGAWRDFDPVSAPQLVYRREPHRSAPAA